MKIVLITPRFDSQPSSMSWDIRSVECQFTQTEHIFAFYIAKRQAETCDESVTKHYVASYNYRIIRTEEELLEEVGLRGPVAVTALRVSDSFMVIWS